MTVLNRFSSYHEHLRLVFYDDELSQRIIVFFFPTSFVFDTLRSN